MPLPLLPEEIVIQATLLVAVQPQAAVVVTLSQLSVAPAAADRLVGEKNPVARQRAGSRCGACPGPRIMGQMTAIRASLERELSVDYRTIPFPHPGCFRGIFFRSRITLLGRNGIVNSDVTGRLSK